MAVAGEKTENVEAAYKRALEIAGDQESRLLQLRAATSLGQHWCDQGKATEAREMLSPHFAWFTEGFDTPDLKAAKSLLNTIS